MIDRTIELATQAADVVRKTPPLELVCAPQLSTVVFRFVPQRKEHADGINASIRQRLFEQGKAVIGHTRVHGRQCLKFTCMNPTVTEAQIESLVHRIVTAGREAESDAPGDGARLPQKSL